VVREIIWNKKATLQFQIIQEYLSQKWGEQSERKFTRRLFDFLDILQKYPFIGEVQYANKDVRGFVLSSQTKLFYKVTTNAIYILAFYDTRCDSEYFIE